MRSVPLEFVFTPPSWWCITDIEILEQAGQINIEAMGLIQMMHPEYQLNNKLVGKQVLANTEMYNEVAEEQYGLRKHHRAGLFVLNEVLVGDLFCYTRRTSCYGMNDAQGYFDRV